MKKILIFCQAPADIQYALSIYDKYKSSYSFHFFSINVEGMYKFLKDLNLENAQIDFIPYPDFKIKNPISVIKARKYVKTNIKRYFSGIRGCVIYYFSNTFDWLTYAFIANLAQTNSVFNCDHYENVVTYTRDKSVSIKKALLLFLFWYVTNVCAYINYINGRRVISFNPERYGVVRKEICISKEIYEKYAYHIDTNHSKGVLFFETDLSSYKMISNYDDTLKEVIHCIVNKGFDVYIKPHPRLGCTRFLEDYNVKILPEYIPGEFISVEDFCLILGILTTSIGLISEYIHVQTYSILDLFVFYDESIKEYYRTALVKRSHGNLEFIYSLTDFDEICSELIKKHCIKNLDYKKI